MTWCGFDLPQSWIIQVSAKRIDIGMGTEKKDCTTATTTVSADDNSTRNSNINHKSSNNINNSFIFCSNHGAARLGSIAPAMPQQCHLWLGSIAPAMPQQCYGKGSRRWATWTI